MDSVSGPVNAAIVNNTIKVHGLTYANNGDSVIYDYLSPYFLYVLCTITES